MLGNRLACVKRATQLRTDDLQMMLCRLALRRYEQADAGDATSPCPGGLCGTFDGHAADGKHGNTGSCATRGAKLTETGNRMPGGFRGRVVHGPENQVIDASAARHRTGIVRTVNRSPDDRVFTDKRSRGRRTERVGAQMHTVSTRRDRDVSTIVEDDSGARALDGCAASSGQRRQRARGQIPLANLKQVDAGARCGACKLDNAIDGIRTSGETPSIGHEANHDCSIVSMVSMRRRATSTDASSLKPINKFTTPRPDTAPRT